MRIAIVGSGHRHMRERAGSGFACFVVLRGALGLLLCEERFAAGEPP